MNGWVGGQMDRWMDELIHFGWMDGWMDDLIHRGTGEQLD
jgi:hypothetical protein